MATAELRCRRRAPPRHWPAASRRKRRWALITAYVSLILFAIFFLAPPFYMLVTA